MDKVADEIDRQVWDAPRKPKVSITPAKGTKMPRPYIVPLAALLSVGISFAWGAAENLKAARLQHEWNQRGFIGCEDGRFVVRNFDIGDLGSFKGSVFNLPTDDPCAKSH